MIRYDVIVVGGGHAGHRGRGGGRAHRRRDGAGHAQAATIGEMSCNPAIGGLGKGHLVREIDALDGVMGRAADRGGIQFRMLNRRKGPAVRGPRAQADRKLYRQAVQARWRVRRASTIVEGEVEDLIVDERRGRRASSGRRARALRRRPWC